MKSNQTVLRLGICILVVLIFVLDNLYFFLIKLGGYSLLITSTVRLICFIAILVFVIRLTVKIIKHEKWRNVKNYLTLGFFFVFFVFMSFFSMPIDESTFQSPVKIKACYEGTMNTSRLYLRENGQFEDYNIGFFAYIHYQSGIWMQVGDTLLLSLEQKNGMLAEKMLIKDNFLYKIGKDTLLPTHYYLGDCKGLN